MFGKVIVTVGAVAAAMVVSAVAQANEPLRLDSAAPFNERYADTAQVGGTRLVGLMYVPASGALTFAGLKVILPATAGTTLCLDVTTRDARYTASNPYAVPQTGGWTVAQPVFATRYQAELSTYSSEDAAVVASLAADCAADQDRTYVVAAIGAETAQLIVKVNSFGLKTRARLLAEDGSVLSEAVCTEPPGGSLVAYDQDCRLAVPADPAATSMQLELTRRKQTGGLQTETFKIALKQA